MTISPSGRSVLTVLFISRTLVTPADEANPARFLLELEVCGEELRVNADGTGDWTPASDDRDRETWNIVRRRFGPELEDLLNARVRRWVGA